MLSNLRIIVVILFFSFTFCLLQVSQSVKETPIKRSLSEFPTRVGDWTRVNTRSLSNSAINLLRPDDYIDYTYSSVDSSVLNLFVSYYGSLENNGGYHSPRNCIPANGWDISFAKTLALNANYSESKPKPVRINMLYAKKGIDTKVILYWYQSRGRIISSEYSEKIYLVWDSLFQRRRDGSLVMITAHVKDGKINELVSSVKAFASQSMMILEEFIPSS